jgi:transcriptional antiterminator RfaH
MSSLSSLPLSWYVIHTRRLQEDRAGANLSAWGIETFVPRLMTRTAPPRIDALFPGYIFARFNIEAMLRKICFTRGVAHVVSFGGIPASIGDEIITMIRYRVEKDGFIRTGQDFEPGDKVIINSGPLQDLAGVFERDLPAQNRVRILLNTAAYSARVEVSRHEVTKIGDRKLMGKPFVAVPGSRWSA